jgi:hypothetical protein
MSRETLCVRVGGANVGADKVQQKCKKNRWCKWPNGWRGAGGQNRQNGARGRHDEQWLWEDQACEEPPRLGVPLDAGQRTRSEQALVMRHFEELR